MKWLIVSAAAGALLGLGSCATMSADQCLAGDWAGQGFSDGASGLSMSRLNDHAEACAKHGVTPDAASYAAGRDRGLVRYCRLAHGFRAGNTGSGYGGVCPAWLEADFMPAYRDGQSVHGVEQALTNAHSRVASLGAELEELDDKIPAKQAEARAFPQSVRRLVIVHSGWTDQSSRSMRPVVVRRRINSSAWS
ncbi:DUF2799 domain-containing protein [Brevundimonas sp.]|uniref:DUF2799 domain-containing protein n=1 Tax=Brevundimonas sp. TaxID=1871086 RepID=UPI003F6F9595